MRHFQAIFAVRNDESATEGKGAAREAKRRLLNFVLSNSTLHNGELTVQFRQPFKSYRENVSI